MSSDNNEIEEKEKEENMPAVKNNGGTEGSDVDVTNLERSRSISSMTTVSGSPEIEAASKRLRIRQKFESIFDRDFTSDSSVSSDSIPGSPVHEASRKKISIKEKFAEMFDTEDSSESSDSDTA